MQQSDLQTKWFKLPTAKDNISKKDGSTVIRQVPDKIADDGLKEELWSTHLPVNHYPSCIKTAARPLRTTIVMHKRLRRAGSVNLSVEEIADRTYDS